VPGAGRQESSRRSASLFVMFVVGNAMWYRRVYCSAGTPQLNYSLVPGAGEIVRGPRRAPGPTGQHPILAIDLDSTQKNRSGKDASSAATKRTTGASSNSRLLEGMELRGGAEEETLNQQHVSDCWALSSGPGRVL